MINYTQELLSGLGWWAVEVFADVKDISIYVQYFKEDRLPAVVVMGGVKKKENLNRKCCLVLVWLAL